ncbi:hypothetical protein [Micromonospora sp. CB01531]|uniref:hypothetical protein n=1 Tax=Micromonospora sp. CB01531 TaxID=1718947 RepID=UPI001F51CF8B|nr:hypothetical protein [Micromonospora sp. CB01531]
MVILRGRPPTETVALANRAWDVGIHHVEVPIGQPEQVAALAATVEAAADRGRVVGAGTVVTVEQVRAAARAGARYTIAPGFDPSIYAVSVSAGLPHLPSVGTATEVQRVRGAGCGWVKAFPAESLGVGWFSALHGPFRDVLCGHRWDHGGHRTAIPRRRRSDGGPGLGTVRFRPVGAVAGASRSGADQGARTLTAARSAGGPHGAARSSTVPLSGPSSSPACGVASTSRRSS